MSNLIDLTGQVFGRLTVIELAGMNKHRQSIWLCKCCCGVNKIIPSHDLRQGAINSCGCLHSERAKKRGTIHGMRNSSEYSSWRNMKNRCLNSNTDRYKDYGGRGISICESWLNSFENFFADMGPKPKGYSIERINNDGNYCPENCIWADDKTQQRNRRNNKSKS